MRARDSDDGTKSFIYEPQGDSPIMFVRLGTLSNDAESKAKSYARMYKDEVVGEVGQIEIGGYKGWRFIREEINDNMDASAPEKSAASNQLGYRDCYAFFDAPGGMSIMLFGSSNGDYMETLPKAEFLEQALEPFARMLRFSDAAQSGPAGESDGIIPETSPSSAPASTNPLPVMVGEVPAEDNWIICEKIFGDESSYVKLGEVGSVEGYEMNGKVSLDGTHYFSYKPQKDSLIENVLVWPNYACDAETAAKTNARFSEGQAVGSVAQTEIGGRDGWIFISDRADDDSDASASEATTHDQTSRRWCSVYFDTPDGMSVMLKASSNPGHIENLPDAKTFIEALEPFARMLIIGEEAPTHPADPEAEPSATPTLAGDGFTFRNGITWNSTPDEIMESEKANSPVQAKTQSLYITEGIGVGNASVASQKADLAYLFSDGRLAMILYYFGDEGYVSASTLNRALSSKYGPSASFDPSGLVKTMNALSGDLPEELGEDDKVAVWLLSDGTRVTLCYSGYRAIMITYENVDLLDSLLSGPPENAGGNTDGL